MEINEKIKVFVSVYTDMFVDGHSYFKEIISLANVDFKFGNIPYQYTYDEFCKEYLMEIENNPYRFEVFAGTNRSQFMTIFANISFDICEDLIRNKVISLGYDWSKFKNNVSFNSGFKVKNRH